MDDELEVALQLLLGLHAQVRFMDVTPRVCGSYVRFVAVLGAAGRFKQRHHRSSVRRWLSVQQDW
jgi:hypothetical protein